MLDTEHTMQQAQCYLRDLLSGRGSDPSQVSNIFKSTGDKKGIRIQKYSITGSIS